MKTTSIFVALIGVAIIIICLIYFRPALDVVDSETMTATPAGSKTSEWPLFIGILTTFVGITFYFVATHDKASKKR